MRWKEFCKPNIEGGMGFKDLAMFNDALLAKQAWWLLHNKDSLFYRVFNSSLIALFWKSKKVCRGLIFGKVF